MIHPVRRFVFATVVALTLVAFAPPAQAVILYRTSTRNTSAPTATKTNSGWQWSGNWGGFLGTPIAPNYFITAEHIGGTVGGSLTLNGKSYKTDKQFDDPSTDLRIYHVTTPFSSWAPLYTGLSETNKWAVIFGRGTQRGTAVTRNNVTKGWKWGADDRVKNWGENYVAGITAGGAGKGDLLRFTFSSDKKLYSEGSLSTGDSAGPLFVYDSDLKWKLAGINYLVDGPFSLSGTNGTGFMASIYDKGGLYSGGDNAWKYTVDTAADVPASFYATRVSVRSVWIKSIIGTGAASAALPSDSFSTNAVPEPIGLGVLITVATVLLPRRRSR